MIAKQDYVHKPCNPRQHIYILSHSLYDGKMSSIGTKDIFEECFLCSTLVLIWRHFKKSRWVDEVSLEFTVGDFLVGHGCLSLELLERLVVG